MRPSLIVTDLDGTLWSDTKATDLTRAALASLRDMSIPVIAATARGAVATKVVFDKNGIDMPSVLLNGALGRDFATSTTFHRTPIDYETALKVVHAFESSGVSPYLALESEKTGYLHTPLASGSKQFLNFYAPYVQLTDDLSADLESNPVFQVAATGIGRDEAEIVERNLSGINGMLGFVMAEPNWLDVGDTTVIVQSVNAGKWSGVLSYCARYGVDPGSVLAIGDDVNDLDLLTNAKIACAMSHAPDVLKDVADVVFNEWADVLDLT